MIVYVISTIMTFVTRGKLTLFYRLGHKCVKNQMQAKKQGEKVISYRVFFVSLALSGGYAGDVK